MELTNFVKSIQKMNGNYLRKAEDIYISLINMKSVPAFIENCDNLPSVLFTPFLVDTETGTVYELYYYEFEIEVSDISNSQYIAYPKGNILPKEIIENIYPKAIVAKNDKEFFIASLRKYIVAMEKMSFDRDKALIPFLRGCELFFQIY